MSYTRVSELAGRAHAQAIQSEVYAESDYEKEMARALGNLANAVEELAKSLHRDQ
ncbi:Hypotetical protein [Gulosibacter molinativorax]|nr:Hypotetical protein [Gulosibacter molinativorax]